MTAMNDCAYCRRVERSRYKLSMKRRKTTTALRLSPMFTLAVVTLLSQGAYLCLRLIVTLLFCQYLVVARYCNELQFSVTFNALQCLQCNVVW